MDKKSVTKQSYQLDNTGMKRRLEDICHKSVKEKYGYEQKMIPSRIQNRLREEIEAIDKMGQSVIFVLIHDMIVELNLKPYDYLTKLYCGNLFVSYLCNITDFDPIEYNLSAYITYTYDQNRKIDADICISKENKSKAINWFLHHELIEGCPIVAGSHSGLPDGIILVPKGVDYKNILSITKDKNGIEYAMEDRHEIEDIFYIQDLIPHELPKTLKKLYKIAKVSDEDISFNDSRILNQMISNLEWLIPGGISKKDYKKIIQKCCINSLEELIQLHCLNMADGAWKNNLDKLILSKKVNLKDAITSRDDVYSKMLQLGFSEKESVEISEYVRKGKAFSMNSRLSEYMKTLIKKIQKMKAPDWLFDSLRKIKYLPPKASSIDYMRMQWRLAYFKTYHSKNNKIRRLLLKYKIMNITIGLFETIKNSIKN